MKIEVKTPIASNLDSVLTPRDRIILRCVDCQTFLLPREIHMAVARFRDKRTGEARALPVEVCPVCYDGIGKTEYENSLTVDDELPHSTFLTLTREDYEMTKKAEAWGMTYDVEKKEMRSNLLVHKP